MKTIGMLNLSGREKVVWENCFSKLTSSHVRIEKMDNELIYSKNRTKGMYTLKLGYKTVCDFGGIGEPIWWWKVIWTFKCLLKSHLLMCLTLRNKALT
jgi:hypothetical protein